MKNLLKLPLTLGVALALPALILAGDKDTCPAAKDTCAAGAAKTDTCCAEKIATCPVSGATTKLTPAGDRYLSAQFKVSGMTCAACETSVTKALHAIEGVREASACAQSKVAKVTYLPGKVKDRDLATAIRRAGFKVEAETIAVKVDGLACEACSDKVGKKLAALKGVTEQMVCHESKQAVVTFDPDKVSTRDILAAIDATGFKVAE